jgi:hypothetical protein
VEVTAFGPGYGECLLVHLGAGSWMIVDSCVTADLRLPALDYLDAMGVNAATSVKLVVATHWHDDHVRGISQVVATCVLARVVCSAALNADEILAGIGTYRPDGKFDSLHTTSGVEEMRRTISLLGPGTASWAIESRMLYQSLDAPHCRITALSPCDSVLSLAYNEIHDLLVTDPVKTVKRPDRNLGAVALWVEVGDATMLLGADLQEKDSRHPGWTAILGSSTRPEGKAEVFKVPHHGSDNAHLSAVWDQIVAPNPEVVVCPCRNGRTNLPTDDDITRLCKLGRVHLTAPPNSAFVRRNGRRRRPRIAEYGRVTLRRRIGHEESWTVRYEVPAHNPCNAR